MSREEQVATAAEGVSSRIERVDPVAFADEASAILLSAWRPPALHYAPDYVRFHCGYPSDLPRIGLAMMDGPRPVGFIAAVGRRSNHGDLYFSSLLSFVPGVNPMLPIALVRHENRLIRESGRPVLLFTKVGSAGETLLNVRRGRAIVRQRLGEYRVHAAVAPPAANVPGIAALDLAKDRWVAEANRLADDSLLSPALDEADVEHMAKDPNGRRFLAAVNHAGRVIATAMLAITATVSATGLERVPALHYIRFAERSPGALRALLAFAKHPDSPVVSVPNMVNIDADLAKSTGLRGTPSTFAAYLFRSDGEDASYRGTEFEIA